MGAATVALTLGRVPVATIGALLIMGIGGALLLITIQAALSDHHGERRAIALTEANVAAAVAYVVLIGALSLAAVTGAGWRAALLASLALPALLWLRNRRLAIDAPPPDAGRARRAPARVPDRGRDAVLHDRGRVVHHRLGRELRRGRRRRLGRRRGGADGRLLRRRRRGPRARQPAARRHAAAPPARARARGHRRRLRGPVAGGEPVQACSGCPWSASASATSSRSASR